jgi:hypothetical protein
MIWVGLIIFAYSRKKRRLWINKIRNINAEDARLMYGDKEQILEKVELIEPKGIEEKPLILYCKFCKSWFESNQFGIICPLCEHDQIYMAYNCYNCGKWYFKDEPRDNYLCKNRKCKGVKLVRRELKEVKEILGNKGIYLRKYELKKKKFSILE